MKLELNIDQMETIIKLIKSEVEYLSDCASEQDKNRIADMSAILKKASCILSGEQNKIARAKRYEALNSKKARVL